MNSEADEKTAAVERQIKTLDAMLASALALAPFSFDKLMASTASPRFDPGPLGQAGTVPDWADFAPPRPSWPRRLTGARSRRRQQAAARARFEAAQSGHRSQEAQRRQALTQAKARYDQEVTEEHVRAVRRNADIASRRSAFAARDAESVEWYVSQVLAASRYPDVFPREHRVAYRARSGQVVIEFELPPRRIVPSVRAFRYVQARDAVEPLPRPEREIRQRYTRLISSLALRTLHEVFSATPPEVVGSVVFNGLVATVDRATGKPVRPYLLSVSAERQAFDDLVLAAVEPVACLRHLNALTSPDPFDLQAVEPLVSLDRG